MNGKEKIISKILSDADNKCQAILADANTKAQNIISETQAQIDAERVALQNRVKISHEEKLRNSLASAELESRKYKLNKKQELISQVYQRVQQQIVAFDEKQKLAFVTKLIETYAEQGETVCICKADQKVITQKFLDGFGKGLRLSAEFVDAQGGIVLVNEGYQKDLTISRVVAYLREQTESQVAQALFGDKK